MNLNSDVFFESIGLLFRIITIGGLIYLFYVSEVNDKKIDALSRMIDRLINIADVQKNINNTSTKRLINCLVDFIAEFLWLMCRIVFSFK